MNTLVTIATYEQSKTACILKDLLENENIDCYSAFSHNKEKNADVVQVQVKEEDVERAIKIMLSIEEKYGKKIEEIEPVNQFHRILVPTDFSPGSENACYYAIHLAKYLNAEIKILHVYENPITDVGVKESATFEVYAAHLRKEMEKKAKEGIVTFTQKMKDYMEMNEIQDVKIHSSMVMGNIIGRIKEISMNYMTDLMVLGTVGKREAPVSILADVAKEIIKRLNIPVYAIPGPCSSKDFEKVRILYATDFNEKDNTSLNQLLKIVNPFNKSIACIHIDTAHNPSKVERMDELNELLKREYSQHEIYCRLIEDEDVYHGIKDFSEKNDVNLLSFTTQKRGIFEKLFKPNLFKKILQESSLPILIFPS